MDLEVLSYLTAVLLYLKYDQGASCWYKVPPDSCKSSTFLILVEQGFELLYVFFLHQAANRTRHPPTLTQTTRNSYFSLNRSACGVQEKQMRPTYSVEMLNKSWHRGLDYFFFFSIVELMEKFKVCKFVLMTHIASSWHAPLKRRFLQELCTAY